jgi:hypothetical protein
MLPDSRDGAARAVDQSFRQDQAEGHEMATRYNAPDGATTDQPGFAFVAERVLKGGAAYWKSYSCTAWIEHLDSGAQLTLMVEPGTGVYVRFTPASGADEFALVDPGVTAGGELSLWPGGDELLVPRAQVVQPELALHAIRCFLEEGARLPQGQWAVIGLEA